MLNFASNRLINIGYYTFEILDLSQIADVGGLYVPLDFNNIVLDVGESGQLYTRLSNHEREFLWHSHTGGTYRLAILFTPRWSAEQRRAVEQNIRTAYQPRFGVF